MPTLAPEGNGGVEEKPKDSGRGERPGAATPAAGGIRAPGHHGELGHDGVAEVEERKKDRSSNDPEEDKSEGKGALDIGPAASSHGIVPDEAKQDDLDYLRDIIENDDFKRLDDLLAGGRAKELLRRTYGGSHGDLDTYGLYCGTLPLFHAVKCDGSALSLTSVLIALENEGLLQEQLMATDDGGRTVLHLAALSEGSFSILQAMMVVVMHLDESQLSDIVGSKNVFGESLLSKAVESGDVELFKVVRKHAWEILNPNQHEALVDSKNIFGDSLLAKAFDTRKLEMFGAVLECAWEVLDHHQLVEFLRLEDHGETPAEKFAGEVLACSRLLFRKALDAKDLGIVEAAVNFVVGRSNSVEEEMKKGILDALEDLMADEASQHLSRPSTLRVFRPLASMLLDCSISGRKVAQERSLLMDKTFERVHLECRGVKEVDLDILFSLIANSARPSASALKELSRLRSSGESFKSCCKRAVTSAANPFIPGVTLSIRLSEAARQASEGEQRALLDTKSSIDELMLEMFERLPQTVRGFEEQAGVDACTNVLEPELMRPRNESNGLGGPLDMVVLEQQQLEKFCTVPLVMDFLSKKFTLGLPDLIDTEGLLRNKDQLRNLQETGLVRFEMDGYYSFSNLLRGCALSVLHGFLPSTGSRLVFRRSILKFLDGVPLTFLPGAQAIVAGMVAAPTNYYQVPAMRMLLDFVVYVGMVALLSYFVLFHSTTGRGSGLDGSVDHSLSLSEGACALIFITAGVYREGREMKRGIHGYFKDQWNVLDALGILCLFVGLVIRWDDGTSRWGPAFYALSAPLVVSRVLFFAQILHFQGPMIQVIFRMTATLLQFGAVMLVVMIGFTMALHVLFHDLEDFGDSLLGLFKAMLGDTGIFDEFSGERYDAVATVLLVVYLFIVTIMLLNLLIAILSTSHAQRGPPTVESMLKKGRGGVGAETLLAFLEDPMDDEDVRQDEKDRNTTVEHIKLLRDRLERTTDEKLQAFRNSIKNELREVLDATKELKKLLRA
eukprot:g16741.t1